MIQRSRDKSFRRACTGETICLGDLNDMRIALRIAGVLARSNPYGIITGNYKEKRFDVLAREED